VGGHISPVPTICYNTQPPAVSCPAATGGSGTYNYQWFSSSDTSTNSTLISGATGTSYQPPVLITTTFYKRTVTSGSCGSVSTNWVAVAVYPPMTPGISAGNESICYGSQPDQITATLPAGGSGSFTYQWESYSGTGLWSPLPGQT